MGDKITVQKEDILNAYNQASEEQKTLLENMFGKDIFKPNDIKERVKSFDDAVKILGNDNQAVIDYYDIATDTCTVDIPAFAKLKVIAEALNEGWEPQFTKDEHHWYPWFVLWDKKGMKDKYEVEKKFWPFGSNLNKTPNCNLVYVNSVVHSNLPASLAVKSEELAEYFGKQFIDIWVSFLSA